MLYSTESNVYFQKGRHHYFRISNYLFTFITIISNRAIIVGRDYPHPDGIEHVRRKWKEALRNPENCQLVGDNAQEDERIIRKAVGRGRYVSGFCSSTRLRINILCGSALI